MGKGQAPIANIEGVSWAGSGRARCLVTERGLYWVGSCEGTKLDSDLMPRLLEGDLGVRTELCVGEGDIGGREGQETTRECSQQEKTETCKGVVAVGAEKGLHWEARSSTLFWKMIASWKC